MRFCACAFSATGPGIRPVDDDFGAVLRDFDRFLDTHAFLGEAMPAFRPGFGPDQMAAFLGAPLVFSREAGYTSWNRRNSPTFRSLE